MTAGAVSDSEWQGLTRALGHPEWLEDERFATPTERARNARELVALLDAAFATKTLDEWIEVFATEPDFFWAPINSIDDVLADPQSVAAGMFVDVPDDVGATRMVATPVDFHGTPWAPRWLAPGLGEHTHSVLEELGYDRDRVAALVDQGVVS